MGSETDRGMSINEDADTNVNVHVKIIFHAYVDTDIRADA